MQVVAAILSAALQLFTSRSGQLALAFGVGWIWSWWRTDASWKEAVAAEKARIEQQYQRELARQEQAARDIAADATARIEEEISYNADLQEILKGYANEEKSARRPESPSTRSDCVIDDHFIGVLRKLPARASASKSTSSSSKLRKAR